MYFKILIHSALTYLFVSQDLMKKIEDYQNQIDNLEGDLRVEQEKSADLQDHNQTLQSDLDKLKDDLEKSENDINARIIAATAIATASLKDKEKEIDDCNVCWPCLKSFAFVL